MHEHYLLSYLLVAVFLFGWISQSVFPGTSRVVCTLAQLTLERQMLQVLPLLHEIDSYRLVDVARQLSYI
jgi:hypothetical protein